MKPYGFGAESPFMARRHDPADATNRTRERMAARRSAARMDGHVDDGAFSDSELACHHCTWGCYYDEGSDLFDAHPPTPLAVPLFAVALRELEAA